MAPPLISDKQKERKRRAELVIVRHYLEKKPVADCYLEAHPGSQASRRTAHKRGSELMGWYRRTYAQDMADLMLLHHMGPDELLEQLKMQLNATLPVKRKNEDGIMELVDSGFPDWKARGAATQMWALVGGYLSTRKGASGPASANGGLPRHADPPVDEDVHTVKIGAPGKIPPEEWKRQYDTHLANPEHSRVAEEAMMELERLAEERESAPV